MSWYWSSIVVVCCVRGVFNISNVKLYFVYWLKIHERRTIVVAPSALYTRR